MFARDMNMGAANASLEMFPEVFQVVDVRVAVGVFARAVVHCLWLNPFLESPL